MVALQCRNNECSGKSCNPVISGIWLCWPTGVHFVPQLQSKSCAAGFSKKNTRHCVGLGSGENAHPSECTNAEVNAKLLMLTVTEEEQGRRCGCQRDSIQHRGGGVGRMRRWPPVVRKGHVSHRVSVAVNATGRLAPPHAYVFLPKGCQRTNQYHKKIPTGQTSR